MKIEIKKQKANSFFDRKELVVEVKNVSTPSYAALKTELAKDLKVGEDVIVVKKIDQQFGKQDVVAHVMIYHSPEALKKYEKVIVSKAAKAAAAKPK